MLYRKGDSLTYVQDFKKRFSNFCDKAPLLISFTTTPTGVQVIDETKDLVFDLEFDYSIPVKAFIHGIKQLLIEKQCYPTLHQVALEEVPLTREEQVSLIAEGNDIEQIPTTRSVERVTTWLIDKVIVFKDQFVIRNLDTDELFLYKMNKPSTFFLQKLRSGKLNSRTGADQFFIHSDMIYQIEVKPGGDER